MDKSQLWLLFCATCFLIFFFKLKGSLSPCQLPESTDLFGNRFIAGSSASEAVLSHLQPRKKRELLSQQDDADDVVPREQVSEQIPCSLVSSLSFPSSAMADEMEAAHPAAFLLPSPFLLRPPYTYVHPFPLASVIWKSRRVEEEV